MSGPRSNLPRLMEEAYQRGRREALNEACRLACWRCALERPIAIGADGLAHHTSPSARCSANRIRQIMEPEKGCCLLYTSDAADE